MSNESSVLESVPVTYESLYSAWKLAYPIQKGKGRKIQNDCNEFWRQNKKNNPILQNKMTDLVLIKKTRKNKLFRSFQRAQNPLNKDRVECEAPQVLEENTVTQNTLFAETNDTPNSLSIESSVQKVTSRKKECPKQEALQSEILQQLDKLKSLINLRKISPKTIPDIDSQIKATDTKIELLRKKRRTLEICRKASKSYRRKQKIALKNIAITNPEASDQMLSFTRNTAGRPAIEETQPGLIETIIKLVSPTGAAEDKRRSDILRSCTTLKSLHSQLVLEGYQISMSGLYLRVLPRNYSTVEGKRHHRAAPVKLLRPQNTERRNHMDAHFAAATIKYLRQLAEIFGEECVCVISQDDKARVPLGIAAATKSAPILINVKYKVALPDHDWAVANRHKLIPSVYAALRFLPTGKLSYSGETYIAIRSGKHDKSTAASHAIDFNRLMGLKSFKNCVQQKDGSIKPIFILLVDGGPDENPRFPKTLQQAFRHFITYDMDALFIACYAPGHSAFNPVERRMAPLSRKLSGVVLPYDHFGSHLDASKNTVDIELEKQNFQQAGEILASLWNDNTIDGYPFRAEFIPPLLNQFSAPVPSQDWIANHVIQSQYLLQIVKCDTVNCCRPLKTNIKTLLPKGFLPPPILFKRGNQSITVVSPSDSPVEAAAYFGDLCHRLTLSNLEPRLGSTSLLPFDLYCPSVREEIESRICPVCGMYFVSKTAVINHTRIHNRPLLDLGNTEEPMVLEENNFVSAGENFDNDDIFPTIANLDDWRSSAFAEPNRHDFDELQMSWGND